MTVTLGALVGNPCVCIWGMRSTPITILISFISAQSNDVHAASFVWPSLTVASACGQHSATPMNGGSRMHTRYRAHANLCPPQSNVELQQSLRSSGVRLYSPNVKCLCGNGQVALLGLTNVAARVILLYPSQGLRDDRVARNVSCDTIYAS